MDMPDVRLADAALDALSRKAALSRSMGALQAALRILCIIRPVADLSPRPRLRNGQLQELVWKIDPSDAAALSQVLELKANGQNRVIIDVLMPGGTELDHLLRMSAGPGPDDLHRLPRAADASPAEYIQCIKNLEVMQQYQMIITGADCLNGEQGLGAYISGRLKRYHYRRERIEVKPDGSGLIHLALPAVVSITDRSGEQFLAMDEALEVQYAPIKIVKTGERIPTASVYSLPQAAPSRSPLVTTAAEAAAYLKAFAASSSGGQAHDHTDGLRTGPMGRGDAVWAVLESHDQKQNLAVLRACYRAATLLGRPVNAVIAAPRDSWPRLLGFARENGSSQGFCLDTGTGRLSKDGRRSLLRLVMNTSDSALILAPLEWTSSQAYVAGETEARERVLCCAGVSGIEKDGPDTLRFSLPCYDGRLLRQFAYPGGKALLSIAAEADFAAAAEQRVFSAQALEIEINPDWLMPIPPAVQPSLSQADVIIDLGYGIRDSAGLELARRLKEKLERLGLAPLFGATRKVTQDLKLLPLDAQIGQTGVRVNPKLIIALGISGAPQHIDYVGTRTEILCFNKDSEAPLMKLNQTRPSPRVHPVPGDLFVTARELVDRLGL
jgi:electron transfer flavoprotein alpha subunit